MTSTKLIGTAPDQVPTNADLGSMAFQDRESVNFLDGCGGLNHLDVTAISAQLGVSPVSVFIYDTSKDSDGGAWRNRCQHTSWYNETLNTTIRGSRREFPSVAILVAESTTITIYDGDDPTLPMWMVFSGVAMLQANVSYPRTCIAALNGILVTGAIVYGVPQANFIKDAGDVYWNHQTRRTHSGNIAQRNTNISYTNDTSALLADYNVRDVAITVLPNAPVDTITKLPIPTIAVATDAGITIIKHDNVVVNKPRNYGADEVYGVRFTVDNGLVYFSAYNDGGHAGLIGYYPPDKLFSTEPTQGADYAWGGTTTFDQRLYVGPNNWSQFDNQLRLLIPYFGRVNNNNYSNYGIAKFASTGSDKFSSGGIGGLTNVSSESSDIYSASGIKSNGMVNYINTQYNSGWLVGDIKGAWLSDTKQETLKRTNLITNGDFSSGSTGWDLSNGNWSVSGGQISCSNSSLNFNQTISLDAGVQYIVRFDVVSISGNIRVEMPNVVAGPDKSTTGKYEAVITPNYSGSNKVYFYGSGGAVTLDNIEIFKADQDRSVKATGLQVYGSITKTTVASNADLVSYSNFSNSNFLYRSASTALSFGSGDFCLVMWMKSYQADTGYAFTQNPNGIRIAHQGSGALRFHVYGDGGNPQYSDSKTVPVNDWYQAVFARRNGKLEIYINGAWAVGAVYSAGTETFNNSLELVIGTSETSGTSTVYSGELALIRLSATVPSKEQIVKMYNDEKVLFQDNAKATLYGTNDSVTGLAYDETTGLLHVGTANGRSVFEGLRRVTNTTTAVSSSISAANGLVAEN